MKNLLFPIAFLFISVSLFAAPETSTVRANGNNYIELPAKITIKGTCIDLITIEYADGSVEFEVYCEGTTGDCVTYDNGSLSTHDCPCNDIVLPTVINFNVEDIGNETQKVTFSN